MKRETQALSSEEMIVYEAVTIARTSTLDALVQATGLSPSAVRQAIERLAELDFIRLKHTKKEKDEEDLEGGTEVELGPNDWDLSHLHRGLSSQ